MKWLWFYIICWKHRNDTRFELFELYTLILKAARRSAYDLNHASSDISMSSYKSEEERSESVEFYWERAHHWLEIFSPTGAKDYRHKLHMEIWNLENKIEKLQKLCDENGIKHDGDEIPF